MRTILIGALILSSCGSVTRKPERVTAETTQAPVVDKAWRCKPGPGAVSITAKIIEQRIGGDYMYFVADKGAKAGVAVGWKGVLTGESGTPYAFGCVTVSEVSETESVTKLKPTHTDVCYDVPCTGLILFSTPAEAP